MGIFQTLALLFLLVPVVEIYLLIKIGSVLGPLPTIFLVVFTAVLGALLLRVQGLYTLQRVREAMARGEVPAMAMLEGAVLIVSGVLLLTPGFFTDALGFLGLIPPVRRWFIRTLLRHGFLAAGGMHRPPYPGASTRDPLHPPHPGTTERGPTTIDGEFRREDE